MSELATAEYEALRAEERDRMNARLTIWTVFLSLTGAFSLASLQNSEIAYLLAVYPALVACLALHTRHSEEVLRAIRKYLFQFEKLQNYSGYEHYSRSVSRLSHGGHIDALRIAFVLSQALASFVVCLHLYSDHVALPVIVGLALVELAIVVITWRWLYPRKKKTQLPLQG
ncbi:MAG TPA: hypothetical protein VH593_07660 [Ktedonobacteraceae bacterium]|jgi:hypothetical protein